VAFTYAWFRYERLMIAARVAAERLIDEPPRSRRSVHSARRSSRTRHSHMLADSLTELWAARLMTYRLAEHGAGADVKIQHAQCSMAKLYASEMAGRVADRAVRSSAGAATCARTSRSALARGPCRPHLGRHERGTNIVRSASEAGSPFVGG
jgi:alkylation response protein AidB-like acyl-CoA dehydrogenase